jgi:hypothetical protein
MFFLLTSVLMGNAFLQEHQRSFCRRRRKFKHPPGKCTAEGEDGKAGLEACRARGTGVRGWGRTTDFTRISRMESKGRCTAHNFGIPLMMSRNL